MEFFVFFVCYLGLYFGWYEGVFIFVVGVVILFFVLLDIVKEEDKGDECVVGLGIYDGEFGRVVVGGIMSLEGLGVDDVVEGEGFVDDGGSEGVFGCIGNVGDSLVVEDGEGGYNGVDEVDIG